MTLALMAQINATGAGGRHARATAEGWPQVASRFVALELGPAPATGRVGPAVAEQGRTVTVAVALEHARPLPAAMTAILEGLPPRAEASPVPVAPEARRLEFRVVVARDAPVGRYEGLAVHLSGQVGGRSIVYRIGRGGRFEIHPAGAQATGGDGKPLSQLDALRAREAAAIRPPERGQDR
jgi:hypothetical protein